MAMKWISTEDRLPTKEEAEEYSFLCWSVKFGEEKRSLSSHPVILDFDVDTNMWLDDFCKDYESNPDYHLITKWLIINEPES
jgi:hypothetical protein